MGILPLYAIPSLLSPRSKVIVNDTHMHFKSRTMYEGPEFEYYYVCRQQRDTRYLVTYQKKGGCDKYFVCLDLQPR